MIESLLQIVLSNACVALVLALMAMFVGFKARHPQFAHMLWVLVLARLVAPPVVTVPIISWTQTSDGITVPAQMFSAVPLSAESGLGLERSAADVHRGLMFFEIRNCLIAARPYLLSGWCVGSVWVFVW